MSLRGSSLQLILLCLLLTIVASFAVGCGGGSSGSSSGGGGGGGGGGGAASNWTRLADPFNSGFTHPIASIAIDPNGVIYVAGKADVARSSDGGATWAVIDSGLPGASIVALGLNALNEPIVSVGSSPFVGVYRYTNGVWQQAAGITASRQVSAFTLDSTNALIAVTAWNGDVYRSTDNGSSFTKTASNIGSGAALWTVATAPDGSLWAGGESVNGALRSTDNGSTWEAMGPSDAAGYKGNILVIGFNGVGEALVNRAGNGGATDLQRYSGGQWISASAGLPAYDVVVCMATDAKGEVFGSVPGKAGSSAILYRTTDGGQSWNAYSANLPAGGVVSRLTLDRAGSLYAILHDRTESNAIYKTAGAP